ncbi:MAG: Capsular polysaccharide transport system ATP-binding protein [uncultured Thiotrichaceae bacterium]|uniref:Capsular polysaccharide transport system ATP-binding protein n=1 Tax=uncultured Thiotrichaceae bacterium TaxID=298394 RepID=A0A6S6SBH8_9GAMM|nr:MAG: Capsular polysaccharide transport system ATP-binding protein [uncultured Thiotrichaceae bacterium]
MLRLIAGSEYPDNGDILREGKLSWPLGFSGGFSPNLTGEENLRFICRIYDANIPYVSEYVKDFAELGDFFYEPIRNYSNGMKSRLAFGLSMAIDFEVILVDEILGVGDSSFRKKCTEHFKKKSEESSIIMVSHEMNTIRNFCESILLFDKGGITVFDDVEEAITAYGNL